MTRYTTKNDGLTLSLARTIAAPRAAVWRCWSEPDLLKQWYCPKPWAVTHVDMEVRPGGRMNMTMSGPGGEKINLVGCFLDVARGRRLVFTDGYAEGLMPRENAFMTGSVTLNDTPEGGTEMVWSARHASAADTEKHLAMGFEAGWGAASDQLDELARSIAGAPATSGAALDLRAKVRTCLWFDGNGHEAAAFYVSLLPGSFMETAVAPLADTPPLVVEFTLAGAPYMILNGGSGHPHTPAASISVLTRDQGETDALWARLLDDGGTPGRCGWLIDRFGVSWQIVPEALPRLLASPDKASAARVQSAMMAMDRISIARLEAAFRGTA